MKKWGHTGKEVAAKIFPEIGRVFKSWIGNSGACYDVLNPCCTFKETLHVWLQQGQC